MATVPLIMRLPLERALGIVRRLNLRWRTLPLSGEETVVRFIDALSMLNWWAFRNNCVVKSLAYFAFLHTPAAPLEIIFGVETPGHAGQPLGRRHVWLLKEGKPFLERESVEKYRIIFRYSPDAVNEGLVRQ